jgi:16S rRNA (guanine966-N2)-methyltransferase
MRKLIHNAVQDKPATEAGGRCEVRIIGGRWRGRKLRFPAAEGLRPTPDRVRETVFNWLQPVIAGARCLDLFAGSGALGFESLSRGAREVVFVERDAQVASYLEATLQALAPGQGRVVRTDGVGFLGGPAQPFDIVFVDPPFASGLLPAALERLSRPGWLAGGAFVYVEDAAREGAPVLPAGWTLHRSKRAGEVGYHLARVPAVVGDAGQPPARAEP